MTWLRALLAVVAVAAAVALAAFWQGVDDDGAVPATAGAAAPPAALRAAAPAPAPDLPAAAPARERQPVEPFARGTVRIRVTDDLGTALPGVRITAARTGDGAAPEDPPEALEALADDDGAAVLELAPGRFMVWANQVSQHMPDYDSARTEVEVAAGAELAVALAVERRSTSLTVHCADDLSRPIPNLALLLVRSGNWRRTDADGIARFSGRLESIDDLVATGGQPLAEQYDLRVLARSGRVELARGRDVELRVTLPRLGSLRLEGAGAVDPAARFAAVIRRESALIAEPALRLTFALGELPRDLRIAPGSFSISATPLDAGCDLYLPVLRNIAVEPGGASRAVLHFERPSGVLAGFCRLQGGAPMPYVWVQCAIGGPRPAAGAFEAGDTRLQRTCISGDDGSFRLPGLPEDAALELLPLPATDSGAVYCGSSGQPTLALAGPRADLVLAFEPACSIRGRLLDERTGARVARRYFASIEPRRIGAAHERLVPAGAVGPRADFEFGGLPSGRYRVRWAWSQEELDTAAPLEVTVSNATEAERTAVLELSVALPGDER